MVTRAARCRISRRGASLGATLGAMARSTLPGVPASSARPRRAVCGGGWDGPQKKRPLGEGASARRCYRRGGKGNASPWVWHGQLAEGAPGPLDPPSLRCEGNPRPGRSPPVPAAVLGIEAAVVGRPIDRNPSCARNPPARAASERLPGPAGKRDSNVSRLPCS